MLNRQADFCDICGGLRTEVASRYHLQKTRGRFSAEQLGKAGGDLPEKGWSTNCNRRVINVTKLQLEVKLLVFLMTENTTEICQLYPCNELSCANTALLKVCSLVYS